MTGSVSAWTGVQTTCEITSVSIPRPSSPPREGKVDAHSCTGRSDATPAAVSALMRPCVAKSANRTVVNPLEDSPGAGVDVRGVTEGVMTGVDEVEGTSAAACWTGAGAPGWGAWGFFAGRLRFLGGWPALRVSTGACIVEIGRVVVKCNAHSQKSRVGGDEVSLGHNSQIRPQSARHSCTHPAIFAETSAWNLNQLRSLDSRRVCFYLSSAIPSAPALQQTGA